MKKKENLEEFDSFIDSQDEKLENEVETNPLVEDENIEINEDNPLPNAETIEENNDEFIDSEEELQKEIFSDENFNEIKKIIDEESIADNTSIEDLEEGLKEGIFSNEQFSEIEKIIKETENNSERIEDKEEKTDKLRIIIAIIIIILLLIFVTSLILLLKHDDKKELKSTNNQSNNYKEIMERYGDKVSEKVKLYYQEHHELPESIPAVVIDGYTIICDGVEIYDENSIYLGDCTINDSKETYSYGEDQAVMKPEDPDTNSNSNSDSNSNSLSNTNSTSNSQTNSNSTSNTNSSTNKPSNSNKPTNTNTNKPSNTNTNTSTNKPTNSNTNTNVTPVTTVSLYDEIKKTAKPDNNLNFTTDSGDGIYYTSNETTKVYYYRGSVTNNYVVFAGYCWRIVRTTETDGIKLIYNGDKTCKQEGNNLVIKREQYSTASSNQTRYLSSPIYNTVNNWYETNLKKYQTSLEKINWCNDTTSTSYKRATAGTPSLKCPTSAEKVSGYIGLLTVDEAVYAGSVPSDSRTKTKYNYLRIPQVPLDDGKTNLKTTFKNVLFVTMSQGSGSKYIVDIGSNGEIESIQTNWNIESYNWGSFGVRPVISLNKNAKIKSGKGTISSPYVIE